MKAIRVNSHSIPPEIEDIPDPSPGPGEILIQVAACGLNFADLLLIKGKYQETPPTPFTPGLEMAGTVLALGDGVKGPPVETRVAAFCGQGGLAEKAVVPASSTVVLPPSMPLDLASSFQVTYGTSHVALSHRARLQQGETLLVLGAAGGVGLTAVELGHAMGARVIAVARGPEKLAIAKAAGASILIDSETENLRDRVRELGGADVVYDPVGGQAFTDAMRATNPDGRILIIGFAGGDVQQIPANHLLVKNISVEGFYWGGYLKFRPEVITQSMDQLFEMHAHGVLHPHISHRFPLDRAMEGLDLLRTRKSTGKVVITNPQFEE